MIRTLTFSTLFPNSVQPTHGIFVANRLSHLLDSNKVLTEIVAPVPWFPSKHSGFGEYAQHAAVPCLERYCGSRAYHPRYPVIPKIGMDLAPLLLYLGARRIVASILRQGFDFDLIDAHYFYPDGVAAVLLGKTFGKPVVVTARGTDINHITDFPLPRRLILWAAREAAAVVTVAQALKDRLVALGADAQGIQVLRNGVDLTMFRPHDREAARDKYRVSGRVLLSVGHLIPRKGHHLVIEALAALPDAMLLIVGGGPEQVALTALCHRLGVAERVRFLGQIPHSELAELYSAADVLVLASEREGWANILLESMACGTPVVASRVWGTPEVVTSPAAGLLVAERTGPAFAVAIAQLLTNPPSHAATRAYAEQFSWDATTAGQLDLFSRVITPSSQVVPRRVTERQSSAPVPRVLRAQYSGTTSAAARSADIPMIRTLTFSTLFPNSVQPTHGIFVANRLSHLLDSNKVLTEIVAPVPWFPSKHSGFGEYAQHAAVPCLERYCGSRAYHPRYPVIPKIGMDLAPLLLYLGARRIVASILRQGFDFDLIDAHYFYPDGVAAVLLGKTFGKPVVVTARGTDIHRIADFPLPRRLILWAAREAAAVVTVAQALKDRLVALGADAQGIQVLRNGVDLTMFRPHDREAARDKYRVSGRVLLSVGHLIPLKGHHLVIEALAALPDAMLLIVGGGPEQVALTALCHRLGVAERVRFLGQIPHSELAELYSAADVLVLASEREGWANVLLESMACGTPVVASRVWGTPEVVTSPAAGLLVAERTGPAFAVAIAQLLTNPPSHAATRAYAEQFSWDATTAGQLDLFSRVITPSSQVVPRRVTAPS